jgi:hypothetical protein
MKGYSFLCEAVLVSEDFLHTSEGVEEFLALFVGDDSGTCCANVFREHWLIVAEIC